MILLGYEANGTSPLGFEGNLYRSPVGALNTWEHLPPPIFDRDGGYECRLYSARRSVWWGQIGNLGTLPPTPTFMIARSDNGGNNWHSVVPGAPFPVEDPDIGTLSSWAVYDFLDFGTGPMFAVGKYTTDGFVTSFGLMRSLDFGATFAPYRPAEFESVSDLLTGINLGSGVGLVTAANSSATFVAPLVWRTTDSGVTWTPVSLPAPTQPTDHVNVVITQFVRMASGRIVAAGSRRIFGRSRPTVWYSDDVGVTWTLVTAPIPALDTNTVHFVDSAIVAGGRVVLGVRPDHTGILDTIAFKFYYESSDGITYVPCTFPTNPSDPYVDSGGTNQFTIADDGFVLGTQNGTGSFFTPTVLRVWRGNTQTTPITWEKVLTVSRDAGDNPNCRQSYITNIVGVSVTQPLPDQGGGSTTVQSDNEKIVMEWHK